MNDKNTTLQLNELSAQKMKVDFDSFDITVKELVSMATTGLLDIAPEYQRQFRWDEVRQSEFIESIFLGIPIPSLFTAANVDGSWELIDGVQRLSTLIHFFADATVHRDFNLSEPLILKGLEKLESFNGSTFFDLPVSVQTQFLLRPLKVIAVSDKSDFDVRFDLFERLNSGGVSLTAQEIRSCIYRGSFNIILKELSQSPDFKHIMRLPEEAETNGTREEMLLRFFAFLNNYQAFDHSVVGFLNDYMRSATDGFDYGRNVKIFENTFSQLREALPDGLTRGRSTTPYNLFEAVSVGAALAIEQKGTLYKVDTDTWVRSAEMKRLTTGATNSNPRVRNRIEYARDKFLHE